MDNTSLKPTYSISEALSRGWEAVKNNLGVFIGFTILYVIAAAVASFIPFASFVMGFMYTACMYSAMKTIDRTGSVGFNDLFEWGPQFGKLLLAHLLRTLCIIVPVGIVMLIFVGGALFSSLRSDPEELGQYVAEHLSFFMLIFLAFFVIIMVLSIMFYAFMFLVQIRNMSVGDALGLSVKTGFRNAGRIILVALLSGGIMLLGVMVLFLGLLVAVPVVMALNYYFLRSIFPEEKVNEWDFDQLDGAQGNTNEGM